MTNLKREARKNHVASLLIIFPFALLIFHSSGCGARRTPDLARIFETARATKGKRPVIVVPGVLGSELVNSKTGEVVWVSAKRSKSDGLSLPVNSDSKLNTDDLVARDIVRSVKFAPLVPEIYVYQELIDALKDYAGYREVKWDKAQPGDDADTFYVFAYDWRQDNVQSARQLIERIDDLKRKLNRPDLRFQIVAHSMGGLVARYAAMYGAADLAQGTPQPTWAGAESINNVFMFGTPNEGSMEAFATLLGGYSITEGLRRRIPLLNKLTRDDAFTIPSIYQLLPYNSSAVFLDAQLQPATFDLYDAETWKRYGWGVAGDANLRRRFAEGKISGETTAPVAPIPIDAANRTLDSFLANTLDRARRFHNSLNATSATPSPVRFFAFGGDCEETLARPVVVRDEQRGVWLTFTEARYIPKRFRNNLKRSDLVKLMYEPGDGRVTRRSLLGGYRREIDETSRRVNTSLPENYAVFACDLHGDVQKNKTLQDNLLTVLVGEAMK
jgi:pimeloyl-ACP methyl ester carboxylesterase